MKRFASQIKNTKSQRKNNTTKTLYTTATSPHHGWYIWLSSGKIWWPFCGNWCRSRQRLERGSLSDTNFFYVYFNFFNFLAFYFVFCFLFAFPPLPVSPHLPFLATPTTILTHHLFVLRQFRRFHSFWFALSTPPINRVYNSIATGFWICRRWSVVRLRSCFVNTDSLWRFVARFTCRLSNHEMYKPSFLWTNTGSMPALSLAFWIACGTSFLFTQSVPMLSTRLVWDLPSF